MRQKCRKHFLRHHLQRKPLVSNPGMYHGTCVTQVLWCMSGLLNRGSGENVPGIPGACAKRNLTYLARGPLILLDFVNKKLTLLELPAKRSATIHFTVSNHMLHFDISRECSALQGVMHQWAGAHNQCLQMRDNGIRIYLVSSIVCLADATS